VSEWVEFNAPLDTIQVISEALFVLTDNEILDCGNIQTTSHIIDSCPMTKFDSGLQCLHTADKAAVDWLTLYVAQKHTKQIYQ